MLQFIIIMVLIHLIFKKGLNFGMLVFFGAIGLLLTGLVSMAAIGLDLLSSLLIWL